MDMKKILLCIALFYFSGNLLFAQVVSSIRPDANGEMDKFSEWKTSEVVFEDGKKANFEYRIALVKKKMLACHYELEIKNTSEEKLEFTVKSHYYDKLVKSNFGDKSKEKIKPGKTTNFHFVAQGCKKDKGTDRSDFEHCMSCEFYMEIFVEK